MTKHTDYDALAARLTDPDAPVTAAGPALTGHDAAHAGHDFLLREYGSEEAVRTAMHRPGRPRVGEARGASPTVRGRISPDDFAAFKALEKTTGRSQSDLVRAAVHDYLEAHKVS